MTPAIGKTVGISAPITTIGTWVSQELNTGLFKFVAGDDNRWGLITWDEECGENSFVRLDVLKSSDESVLAADISRKPRGVDLTSFADIASNSIKLKFKLYSKGKRCVVSNVRIKTKQEW